MREKQIAFLKVKVYAVAVYVEDGIRSFLASWHGKEAADLAKDDALYKVLAEGIVCCSLCLRIGHWQNCRVSKIVHKSEGHALSVFAGFVAWCGCGCILTWSRNTVLPPSSQRGKH